MFIDETYVNTLLKNSKNISKEELNKILDKAENLEGLDHAEVAAIINMQYEDLWQRVYDISGKIKEYVYGQRIVIFAPLYVSDYCVNKCSYCGFSVDNNFQRKKLNMSQIKEEVQILEKMGHKRIALEAGEDPINCSIDYVLECIDTIYNMKFENGEIRRLNVNIAATSVENYKKLFDAEIGTYILFQETYHEESYNKVHIKGPKNNYDYHLKAFDRAMEAGISDVGAGVLFGLYDYRYEIISLLLHNEHLEKKYGVGFHTISVPRLCDAKGLDKSFYTQLISDEEFIKIVAILRLTVPYTGIILSTRETQQMRKILIDKGISQISAGSCVEVYGYTNKSENTNQFSVSDERSAKDIIYWIMEENLVPSFCTACYRKSRTGDRFMALAKSGNIKNVCLPNALMTLKEYSIDYGDAKFTALSNKIIDEKLDQITNLKIKEKLKQNLIRISNGERDLYL